MSEKTPGYSVTHRKLGPGDLWKTEGLQLPAYIQNVARGIMRKRGASKSQAIQLAVGAVKRWARGGGDVGPEVRAAAAKAVAEWEAAKAKARATPNKSREHAVQRPAAVELASQEGQRVTVKYGSGPSQQARASAQSKGQAFRDGRFPIRNVADLKKAIRAYGRAKDADKPAIKAFIMRRARALGAANLIPQDWRTQEHSAQRAAAVELAGKRGPYQRHVVHTKQFGKKKGDLASKADWAHGYNPRTELAGALKAKHITNADRTSSGAVKQGKEARVRLPDPPSARPSSAAKTAVKATKETAKPQQVKTAEKGPDQSKTRLRSRRNALLAKQRAGTITPAERTELNKVTRQLKAA